MNPITNKKRIEFIDLAKGLCILLVVWGHSLGPLGSIDSRFVWGTSLFRMPIYFFLSGLFFKTYESFGGFVKRKVNKLLIPFLFWHVLFVCLVPFVSRTETFDMHLFWDFIFPQGDPHNTALWFLCCLFFLNILFFGAFKLAGLISQNDRNRNLWLAVVAGIFGTMGFLCSRYQIHLYLKFETLLTAFPFFYCGFLAGHHKEYLLPNHRIDRWLPLFALVSLMLPYYLATGEALFRYNSYQVSAFSLYVGGIMGVFGILSLAKMIKKLPFVSYLGRYSIMILVTHLPFVWYLTFYLMRFGWVWWVTSLVSTIVTLFSYLAIIPIFKHFLPYVTAQKDILLTNS